MFGAVVDAGALVEVIWVSLVSGIGVAVVFSLALYGSARSAEARRAGNGAAATGYLAIAVATGLVCLVGLVLGVRILIGS